MTAQTQTAARGAMPVGALETLPPDQARLVRYLRLWCDGPDGQAALWNELATRMGPTEGRACLSAFEAAVGMLLRHSRRPLMRHHLECSCVGADEAVFAEFFTAAATGEREDAMMLAVLLVHPAMLMPLVDAAQQAGLRLRRGAPQAPLHDRQPLTMTRH
ncbi:hypothetical protein [Tranquillimonas alkanivorans]|uniref:Uncharacterized protein n=1 Tax=Tranquillimonas alkanivorans TaxID=441119 RepID=A0A1I5MYQ4_9RHOB|nr:hypothetical protein [Tranquillimonas alkanivorans]SFP14673.1 hypothetical protein SAMN04488047_10314 [Tranquillimonas alkanivorans]